MSFGAVLPEKPTALYAYLARGGGEEGETSPPESGSAPVPTVFNRWLKCTGRAREALGSYGAGNTSGRVKTETLLLGNLSRLMELGAESRDPSLSEKVWRKDLSYVAVLGGGAEPCVRGRAAHV